MLDEGSAKGEAMSTEKTSMSAPVHAVVMRFEPLPSHYRPSDTEFARYAERATLQPESDHWTWFVPLVFSSRWAELSMETKYAVYWMACELHNADEYA